MNKWYIGGGIVAAVIILYFVFKKPKPQAGTPASGGQFTPKQLGPEDWAALERTFSGGNPYQGETAKSIDGQPIDENEPTSPDGTAKQLITKVQFNNLVLALIRQHIGARSGWIQEEEFRRFEPWTGAARAGYADSLARAWAYVARVYVANTNYYTATGTPPPAGGTPPPAGGQTENLTAAQLAVKNSGARDKVFYEKDWEATNTPNIYKYINRTPQGGPTIFWSIPNTRIVSIVTARQQGYDGR
jgi:hypothetical protein